MGWFDGRSNARRTRVDPSSATEADVYAAYRLILQREPDASGLAHYLQRVREGLPLAELIHDFVVSDEYHQRLETHRIEDLREVDLGGYKMLVSLGDHEFGAVVHSFGVYEEPVRQVMRETLHRGDVCLDVGANMGVLTFLAATQVGPEGRVIAVEPNPDNVQLLYRNIQFTNATQVEVMPVAASDRRAVFSLTGRSNTHLIAPREPSRGGGYFVQSVVLDDVLSGLERLDFVKMDIEGHEPAALRGMRRLIERHGPTLLIEFNPRCLAVQSEDPAAFIRLLLSRYPKVRAISQFADDATFDRAENLMDFWRRRDRELTSEGRLPAGLLHFDLVLEE